MASDIQSSTLPPAQPAYVFRGHAAHVHSVQFVRQNSRLLTGDADGCIILWNLASKRPVAVWQAHDAAILGFAEWEPDRIITHGRDNSLKVWQLRASEEEHFSIIPPTDGVLTHRPQPWLLHSLAVNTLNFCAFSMCLERPACKPLQKQGTINEQATAHHGATNSILVAVPATEDKKVDIFQIPSEQRIYTVPRIPSTDTGMVMALKLLYHTSQNLLLVAGYESGHTAVHQLDCTKPSSPQPTWHNIYLSQPHAQPILSLDVSPDVKTYFTSSADAIIAAHHIPNPVALDQGTNSPAAPSITSVSSSTTSPSILSTAFAANPSTSALPPTPAPSILSAALASSTASNLTSIPAQLNPIQPSQPFKLANTKHAGQQSLRIRSDSRILATAGWDSRVRVYSTKTLAELAVLKWHRVGVYAVDFADISVRAASKDLSMHREGEGMDAITAKGAGVEDVDRVEDFMKRLERQREEKVREKHWIVAGGKDGKVSLWEIY